jgi:hypothetical protein
MLCVLMPALSFAFADDAIAAPCLTDSDHAMGIVHVHETATGTAQHFQINTHPHDHAYYAKAGREEMVPHPRIASADVQAQAPAKDGHKKYRPQCCGMVCISALPASLTQFVAPFAPTSRCALEIYRHVAGGSPPTHYRPPIS